MIDVKNLTMDYGATRALDDVSFEVKEGEVVGLLGPNGAGKTTLMRILTTYLYPTRGTAVINGIDVTQDPLRVRQMIGYLPETPPLYPDMRVSDFLTFVGESRDLDAAALKRRKEWVIEATQIARVWKHNISELSLGFRQRVGLAQALIHDPQVVILDEPTSGLDPMQIIGIRRLIKDLVQTKTVICSTHILQEASAVADRLVIVDRGRVVANGKLGELKEQKGHDAVFAVTVQAPREDVWAALHSIPTVKELKVAAESAAGIRFVGTAGSRLEVAAYVSRFVREKGWVLEELTLRDPSLEDIFIGFFDTSET